MAIRPKLSPSASPSALSVVRRLPQSRGGPELASEHVDWLLSTPQYPSGEDEDVGHPPPMNGIWLGVAMGMVVWLAALGTALFVWRGG
jgi:hypothetical protein